MNESNALFDDAYIILFVLPKKLDMEPNTIKLTLCEIVLFIKLRKILVNLKLISKMIWLEA